VSKWDENKASTLLCLWALATVLDVWMIWPHLWPIDGFGIVDFDQFLTWQLAVNDAGRSGSLLQWMPYLCGGVMGLGNPQSGALSPFNVFGIFFNPVHQFKLELLVHVLLVPVAFGMLSRALRLPLIVGLFGCLIWVGNGFINFRLLHGQTTFFALLLVPFLLALLIEEIQQAHERRGGFLPTGLSPTRVVMGIAIACLMILQDGLLVLMYTAFLLGGMALIASIRSRDAGPLYLVMVWGIWSVALCAVRLWPMVELLSDTPRNVDDRDFLTLSMAWDALFGIDQRELYHSFSEPNHSVWGAYGAFTGFVPWLLGLYGALRSRGAWRWPLFAVMILGVVLMFGNFASFAPWTLLRHVPPFQMIRAPYRFVILLIFGISVLSMVGAFELYNDLKSRLNVRWDTRTARRVSFMTGALLLLGVGTTLSFSVRPLLEEMIVSRAILPGEISRDKSFGYTVDNPAHMFGHVAAHQCIVNCYASIPFRIGVNPRTPVAYVPEGMGSVSLEAGINQLRLVVNAANPTTVIINHNYHEDWYVMSGNVKSMGPVGLGVIGLSVPAGEQEVVLEFVSASFLLGSVVSALSFAILLLGILIVTRRKLRSASSE